MLGASVVKMHMDSQLVTRQITQEYTPKKDKMTKEKDVVIKALEAFKEWKAF